MTLFFTYDGSDLGNTTVRLEGGLQVTSAADGTIASAQVTIDDPTGALNLKVLQQFSITETACTFTRLYTGYIYAIRIHRGPFVNAAGRVWELEIADLNFLLHLRVLQGSSAKRPLESGNSRLAWLLPAISSLVADNGLVAANPWMFDEADYRGKYPNEVLPDLCVSSSDVVGRIFFVYWDHAAAEAALFLDVPSAAVNSSTLQISNVLTDVDETITFAPDIGSEVGIAGEEVYDGVYFTYKGTSIYRQRAATYTEFGLHRDGVFSTDRVGSAATAIRHADQFLDAHSGEVDTITCLVQLPRSKVNLIDAGMRIRVKFSHLRGYTSFTWMRVQKRTVLLTAGTNEFYDVQLELSTRGRDGLPGGGGGDFPLPPSAPPSIVQEVSGAGNIMMATAITEGNTLVWAGAIRGAAMTTWVADRSYTYAEGPTTDPGGTNAAAIVYKVAGASESQYLGGTVGATNIGNETHGTWYELSGTWTPETTAETASASLTPTTPTIAVTANSIAFGVVGQGQGGAYDSVAATLTYTVAAGWTEDYDAHCPAGGHPNVVNAHRIATTAAGSLSFSAVNSGNGGLSGTDYNYIAQIASFTGSTSNDPPSPGQVVPWTVVTMAGAVGTTAYPYADGSLLVKVQGVLISRASYTETDPAAGTFTLAWSPDPAEVVTVQYIGR